MELSNAKIITAVKADGQLETVDWENIQKAITDQCDLVYLNKIGTQLTSAILFRVLYDIGALYIDGIDAKDIMYLKGVKFGQ